MECYCEEGVGLEEGGEGAGKLFLKLKIFRSQISRQSYNLQDMVLAVCPATPTMPLTAHGSP